jgi:hypothetical protein
LAILEFESGEITRRGTRRVVRVEPCRARPPDRRIPAALRQYACTRRRRTFGTIRATHEPARPMKAPLRSLFSRPPARYARARIACARAHRADIA